MRESRREVEIKIRCSQNLLDRFPELVREVVTPRHFEDNWLLDFGDRRLAEADAIFRLRLVGTQGRVTFKRAIADSSPYKVREEIEVETAQPQALMALLGYLGLQPIFRYQKYRTIYRVRLPSGHTLDAMYDETPIGNFLELEGDEAALDEFLALAGLDPAEVITLSYPALYKAHIQSEDGAENEMVFDTAKGDQ